MLTINSSDIVKKPSYVTRPTDITFIEDAKNILQEVLCCLMNFMKK